jgi:hypothetical protein
MWSVKNIIYRFSINLNNNFESIISLSSIHFVPCRFSLSKPGSVYIDVNFFRAEGFSLSVVTDDVLKK